MTTPIFYQSFKQTFEEISALPAEANYSQAVNSMFTENILENFESSYCSAKFPSFENSHSYQGSLFSESYDAKDEILIEAIKTGENSALNQEFSEDHSCITFDDDHDKDPSQIMKELMNLQNDSQKQPQEIMKIEKEEVKYKVWCNGCLMKTNDTTRCNVF